ncbi:MAG: leucine-rich repeat protein [Tannerellaceae bacterium]|jgi:hypothetical protein|nr:leucine-rich repeat protein [Tannerellaceae bacterium]
MNTLAAFVSFVGRCRLMGVVMAVVLLSPSISYADDNDDINTELTDETRFTIPDRTFYGCSALETCILHHVPLNTIGREAFFSCTSLHSINLPATLDTIYFAAFADCQALDTVDFPHSDETPPHLDNAVFAHTYKDGASNPSQITTSPADIFVFFHDFPTYISYYRHSHWYPFFLDVSLPFEYNIFDQTTAIPPALTSWFNAIGEVHISRVRVSHPDLHQLVIPPTLSLEHLAGNNICAITTIDDGAFTNTPLTSLTFPNTITKIGNSAFENCTNLTEAFLAKSVSLDIPQRAFRNCNALKTITLPSACQSIGETAFANCSALSSISLPNSVTTIEEQAFAGCAALNAVFLYPTVPPSLGNAAFDGIPPDCFFSCPGSVLADYQAKVEWAPYFAVYGFTFRLEFRLEGAGIVVTGPRTSNIYIPDTVLYNSRTYPVIAIDPQAFSGVSSLTSVSLPATLSKIGREAFAGCTALAAVTLRTVTPPTLADNVFNGIPTYTLFSCPDNALTAYQANAQWKSFFPTAVTSLTPFAFRINGNAQAIVTGPNEHTGSQLVIPTSVLYQGQSFPITAIDDYAFANYTALTVVTLAAPTPPALGNGAFSGLANTRFTTSTEAARLLYAAHPDWAPFFAETPNVTYRIDGNNNAIVTGLRSPLTADGVLIIPDVIYHNHIACPVTAIDDNAFANQTTLTAVYLPDALTSFGEAAFAGCASLASLRLPAALTSLPYRLFAGCTSLASIVLPAALTSINDKAFTGCNALASVTLMPYTPPTLGDDVFPATPPTTRFSAPTAALAGYRANSAWAPYFPVTIPYDPTDPNTPTEPSDPTNPVDPTDPTVPTDPLPKEYDILFRLEGSTAIVTGPRDPLATDITIPAAVEVEGKTYAVTAIDYLAFFDCPLRSITLQPATPPTIAPYAFTNIPTSTHFSVDASAGASLVRYQTHAQWQPFFPPDYPFFFRTLGTTAALVTAPNPAHPLWQSSAITLDIPESISGNGNTYRIIGIDANAFANQPALKSVSLPASIEVIAAGAFFPCPALSSVTLHAPQPPALAIKAFPLTTPIYPENPASPITFTPIFTAPAALLSLYQANTSWKPYFLPILTADQAAPLTPNDPNPILTDPNLDPDNPYLIDALIPVTPTADKTEGGERCLLYNLQGRLIYHGPADAIPTGLPAATYILRTPTSTRKIRF